MNRLINKLAGGEKAATPARRAIVIATLITAVAVVLALITLGVTSLLLSMNEEPEDTGRDIEDDVDNIGVPSAPSTALEYKTLTSDELDAKLDKLVEFKSRSERQIANAGANDLYYAKNGVSQLSTGTMEAVHNMLVAFYNANKTAIKTDVGADNNSSTCTIPLLIDSNDAGTSFKLVVFNNNKSTYNNQTYTWIYTNAASYGFVYSENTFTYVGVAAAQYAKTNNTSLDKLANPVSVTVPNGTAKTAYQVYYISADADELNVPTNYEYTVSSYAGGYVITVNMSKKVTA